MGLDQILARAGWVVTLALLVDFVAHIRFFGLAYTLGLPILLRRLPQLARPVSPVGLTGTTDHGAYRLVSSDRLLLRERFSPIDWLGGLGVVLDWSSETPSATARVSLVYVLLAAGGWIMAVALSRTYGEPGYLEWVIPPVLIAVFAGIMIERAQRLVREYMAAGVGADSHA